MSALAGKYVTVATKASRLPERENSDQHLNEAENEAAALLPWPTTPMILFFQHALFAVILMPAMIQLMKW
jgi:tight adherence protein C